MTIYFTKPSHLLITYLVRFELLTQLNYLWSCGWVGWCCGGGGGLLDKHSAEQNVCQAKNKTTNLQDLAQLHINIRTSIIGAPPVTSAMLDRFSISAVLNGDP